MSTSRQQIADWARQLEVSEDALREFLEGASSLPLETAKEALETGAFLIDDDVAAESSGLERGVVSSRTVFESGSGLDVPTEQVLQSEPGTLDTGSSTEPGTDATIEYLPDHSLPGVSWFDDTAPTEGGEHEAGSLGRYQDLGLLGMGGMGEVRRVRDPRLRRSMAMKIIHRHMMDSSRLASRFIEEAQVEAQLQHPNIVPVYEIGRLPDGRFYFTMKQIHGTEFKEKIAAVHAASLDDRWRPAEDGTTFRDLIRIHQQVCETVAYAHAQGVIHRDLKPDNIMIGGFSEVLVVDWGLAKVLGRDETDYNEQTEDLIETDRSSSSAMKTHVGSVAGTPCYMAPEQAFGRTELVGKATDIYTLGGILYEILSGVPPYSGASAAEVLEKVKHSRPSFLRQTDFETSEALSGSNQGGAFSRVSESLQRSAGTKIPERLAQVCESAMQREIGERMASAQELAAALRSWLKGAEKREKALNEVEKARLLADQARGQERKSAAEWRAANDLLERDGAQSEEAWALWSSSQDSEAESRKLWRRYVRQLQGALVHSPDLEEAHEALAQQRIEELIVAAAVGDRAGRETRAQQLSAHLDMLPAGRRSELEAARDAGIADVISGHCLRRGVLVGRHAQRESVADQVDGGARLLTLLGTAGVGKTRLALELAQDLRSGFSRTVFCDLTEARDMLGVAQRLSRALQVRLRDSDPVGHLTEVLAQESTLLVLDNLEQITEVIGPMVSGWLAKSETLQILATSRLRVGVEAEVVAPVQPLTLLEGVDLFVRRGHTADPGFELSPLDRRSICALVEQLDHLPLALELAAARLDTLSLDDLSHRLGERFTLLRSRGRDAQALGGALDWSWGMLQPWTKAALSQASLFRGGFTLASAEGVIEIGKDPKTPAMFDILGELVDNSLLRKDQAESGGVRYSLLESVREYAYYKLGDPGQMGPQLRGPEALIRAQHRYAEYFSHLGTPQALRALDGFDSDGRWEVLFSELDNLVEAIGYGTAESASRCCLAALQVLAMKGPLSLCLDIAAQVLQRTGLSERSRMLVEIEHSKCLRISGRMAEARALVGTTSMPPLETDSAVLRLASERSEEDEDTLIYVRPSGTNTGEGNLSEASTEGISVDDNTRELALIEAERVLELGRIEAHQSHYDKALQCMESAYRVFQAHGDRAGEGSALANLAKLFWEQSQYERAAEFFVLSLAISREMGNKRGEGSTLGNLGLIYQNQGQYDRAIEHFRQAIEIAREGGHSRNEGVRLTNLGGLYQALGQHDRAIEYYVLAIDIARETGDKLNEGLTVGNLGTIYSVLGQHERAIEHYTRAIDIAREGGKKRNEGVNLGNLGDALVKIERFDQAEVAYRSAIVLGDETLPGAAGAFRGSLALLLAQQCKLDEAQTCLEIGEVQVRSEPDEFAKFLCKKGHVCHMAGNTAAAQAALKQAQEIAAELKVSDDSEVGQAIAGLEALLGRVQQ